MATKPWEIRQGSDGGEGGAGTGTATEAQQPSAEVQELIDPNDPRLISEPLDVNLEADAYAQPAPPPDGPYRIKLKLSPMQDVSKGVPDGRGGFLPYRVGQTKKPPIIPYYEAPYSGSIIDRSGKYDGITVFAPYGSSAGTLVQKNGSTKVQTILMRLKQPSGDPWLRPGQRMSSKEWIELFVRALAGEPEIGCLLEWEASCRACSEELKLKGEYAPTVHGMHRFPPERDPAKVKAGDRFDPEILCAVKPAHGLMRAQARIKEFLHLHELPQGK